MLTATELLCKIPIRSEKIPVEKSEQLTNFYRVNNKKLTVMTKNKINRSIYPPIEDGTIAWWEQA